MVVLVCTARKIKPILACANRHGLETIVKSVSEGITAYESENAILVHLRAKINL